jgi:flagellar FliL protein
MAKAAIGEETASAGKVKLPVAMLLVVVMLGACLGTGAAGGGVYFLIKSGKLPIPGAAAADGAGASGTEAAAHQMVLEPILVNLADEGGHAYLRLGLTLDVAGDAGKGEAAGDAKSVKTPSEEQLAVRDTVLAVLGQQTSAWLLGPDGKEHLKIELKEALAKHNPQVKVKDLFFTDFLVQI